MGFFSALAGNTATAAKPAPPGQHASKQASIRNTKVSAKPQEKTEKITPEKEAELRKAALEKDFFDFAQYMLVPGGNVHGMEIVKMFQNGVHGKYDGHVRVSDVECLLLLKEWNAKYPKAAWNKEGWYIGIKLNPNVVGMQKTPEQIAHEKQLAQAAKVAEMRMIMKAANEQAARAKKARDMQMLLAAQKAASMRVQKSKDAPAASTAAAASPPADPKPLTAVFSNSGKIPAMAKAELYYEQTRWGNIGHGDPPVSVGTFTGHKWFVKVGDQVVKSFVIGKEDVQEFSF